MVKSMFAAVAGLRTHQSKMDVIGNNIANVNTWGYKAGSMSFKDTMYQTSASGSGGSTEAGSYGGTNANQVGYGVTTGSITYDFGSGGMSPSSRGLDCMIDGSGFFFVGPMHDGPITLDSEDAIRSSGLKLSRVGKFDVDSHGYLVDDAGNYVYGFVNSSDDITSSDSFDTTSLQPLKIPTTADMATVKNNNASTDVSDAKTAYNEAVAALNTAQGSLGTAEQEYIEAKNAYDSEYTAQGIATKKSDYEAAETTMNTAYKAWIDNPDPANELNLREAYYTAKRDYETKKYIYIKDNTNLCTNSASTTDLDTAWGNYITAFENYWGTAGSPIDPLDPANKPALDDALKTLQGYENDLSKTESGSLLDTMTSAKLEVDKASAAVTAAEKKVTQAANGVTSAQDSATSTASSNTTADDTLEKMTSYKILNNGTVTGVASDGSTIVLGKIALAGVQNTSGLVKDSGYYYSIGANAGNVSAYEAGGSEGKILGNYLEMAKVDLATEMTDMITTQRGFQANSKIITVTDTMLEELVNMKR